MPRTGLFCLYLLSCVSVMADDWPQWRGPNRDEVSRETGLLKEWPDGGPEVLWKVATVGKSYSAVSVANGRIYTQGNVDGEGRILCLDPADGSIIWSIRSPAEERVYTHNRGDGARGTPTVDGTLLYAEGGSGDVTCLNAVSGEVVWSRSLTKDFGGSVPGWGYSESPLIDGDRVIVTPGGSQGLVVALDKKNGDMIWQSSDVTDRAHYCSAILIESHGVRQIVTFTGGTGKKSDGAPPRVVGLDAETGKLLWSYDKSANGTANVSSPVYFNETVFSASAYGTGGGLAKLIKNDDGFVAEPGYFIKSMQNHHGGMVLVDGFLYGFGSNALLCVHFETGDIAWQDRSVGKGSLTYADGHLYCYGEKNSVALVEANPKEYVEKGRFDVEKLDFATWAHPVVANGRLYLRDMDNLTCYKVAAE